MLPFYLPLAILPYDPRTNFPSIHPTILPQPCTSTIQPYHHPNHHTIQHSTLLPTYHKHTHLNQYPTLPSPNHHTILPSFHHTTLPSSYHTIPSSFHHTILLPSTHHTSYQPPLVSHCVRTLACSLGAACTPHYYLLLMNK